MTTKTVEVYETYSKPRSALWERTPDLGRITRYRITVEEIEDPPEVVRARVMEVIDSGQWTHHSYETLRQLARQHRFGFDQVPGPYSHAGSRYKTREPNEDDIKRWADAERWEAERKARQEAERQERNRKARERRAAKKAGAK